MASPSVKKNYLLNLSYQVFSLIAPLITAPYVSRVLGADGIGTYSYAESIASYFVLTAVLGTSSYGQREISYLQDDLDRRTRLFWNVACLRLITTASCLIAFLVFSGLQPNPALFMALSLNVATVALDFTWLFQGMEDFISVVRRNYIVRIASIVFIFALVREPSDLVVYALVLTITPAAGCLMLWPMLRRYIGRLRLHDLRPFSNIRTVLSLFVPTIAISVYTMLDKTMIGLITADASQNGYYEQALKISHVALTVVTSLGTVMVPRIGHLHAIGENTRVRDYMYRSYRFVWLLGMPLCFGLIAVAPNFVPWFYGEGFISAVPLLQILAFLVLAIGINNVTGIQYLIPVGRQNTFTATVAVGAAINFVMNLALIPFFGAMGATVSSVIAETVIAVLQLIIVRDELNPTTVIKSSWKYLLSGGVMLAVLLALGSQLSSSIINTLVMIAVGACVYGAVLFFLKDEFLSEYASKALGRLRKMNK